MSLENTSTIKLLIGTGGQLPWLGPVRMLVMAVIAFGYASTMPRGPEKEEYLNLFGYDPSWIGIQVIFMITGFLAMKSLMRHRSPLKFLISRVVRTLPTLLIFATLVVFVIFPLFGNPVPAGESRVVQHLSYFFKVITCVDPDVLTPGLLDNALYMCIIQGGIWTFRWGVIAFVATAILWAIGGLRNPRILALMTAMCIVTFAGIMVLASRNPEMAQSRILELVVTGLRLGWAYLLGMCFYAYRTYLSRSWLIPLGFIGLAWVQFATLPWTPIIEIFLEIGFGYGVMLAMTSSRPVPDMIAKTPDLSLGLYVFNWPAAQIMLLLVPSIDPLGLFGISFSVTILISLIIWYAVSRPINLRLSQRLFRDFQNVPEQAQA